MKLLKIIQENCTGCRLCEMACSFRCEGEFSTALSRIKMLREHEYGNHLVQVCTQCAEAPCIESCPSAALYRDEKTGIVKVNQNCRGCGDCFSVCPFHAIWVDIKKGKSFKCELCGGDPECIKMCPRNAILLVDEELDSPEHRAAEEEVIRQLPERMGL